ncbi:glycoside hydrolase family 31 protein [Thermogemmatispora sp.]|uniref:glycoside hydrolase family 31 protein n=1 Tax=Thermogemmatispora sp. TaxID=1968838 RepID=UPI0035E40F9D
MERAQPVASSAHPAAIRPDGYQVLGRGQVCERAGASICLRSGSATVEVTALAPDLFRVGFFLDGRPRRYESPAVVEQEWSLDSVSITEPQAGQLSLATSFATAHLSLDPLRLSFSDPSGRVFAADDPELGMGWFAEPAEETPLSLANVAGTLGLPLRVYKRHLAEEHYFACGERSGGLDKTGSYQLFWNTDPPPGRSVFQSNLYVSIPFTLVLANGLAWGLFLDNPGRVAFDLAHEHPERSWFGTSTGDLIYYVFCGPTPQAVLERYTALTGRTPLPPLWSLGNGQSRFSYASAEELRTVAATFRARDIPCDTLYLDIDALDGYRVFTWDRQRFPDPAGLFSELRAQGFHVVSIVDAGIKVDENYPVYRDGKRRDLYCKTPEYQDYQNAVWPGLCVFPDVTNPAARAWWGEQHRPLLEAGVAGIWTDMNEPAVFIPVHGTLPAETIHPGGGRPRLHAEIHNAYGSLLVQATREGLQRLRPEQRPFVISRAGYAGIQRHALIWTGDNASTWEDLALSVPQLLNLGLSGVSWCGSDIGGFYGDCTGELLARWTEFGIFQAFCRNHSEKQSRHQEPWVFGEPYESVCRALLKLRQRLLPYLYTLFEECHRSGAPILRPLFWEAPTDSVAWAIDDEVLCGKALLVAPITRPGMAHRHVYLPAGTWFHFWSGQRLRGPTHLVAYAPLGQPAIYVRANTALPLWPAMNYVGELPPDPLTLLLYPAEGQGESSLYEDAGDGYGYLEGEYARRTILCEVEGDEIRVFLGAREGSFVPPRQEIMLELRALGRPPRDVRWSHGPAGRARWHYDRLQGCLLVTVQEMAEAQEIVVQLTGDADEGAENRQEREGRPGQISERSAERS